VESTTGFRRYVSGELGELIKPTPTMGELLTMANTQQNTVQMVHSERRFSD
jgi:hypothetical protein